MTNQIIVNVFVNQMGFVMSSCIKAGLTGKKLRADVVDLLSQFRECEDYNTEQLNELADDCIAALYNSDWFK